MTTISASWLWFRCAIDASGSKLDILVQTHCDATAAQRFLRRLICAYLGMRVVIFVRVPKVHKPTRSLAPSADHKTHHGLTNRAEEALRRNRKREGTLRRLYSPAQPQRSLTAHDQIKVEIRTNRYQMKRKRNRQPKAAAIDLWHN